MLLIYRLDFIYIYLNQNYYLKSILKEFRFMISYNPSEKPVKLYDFNRFYLKSNYFIKNTINLFEILIFIYKL